MYRAEAEVEAEKSHTKKMQEEKMDEAIIQRDVPVTTAAAA